MNDWATGILGIVAALAVAAGIAWAGSMDSTVYAGWPVFLWCGIFAYGIQWLVFIHAWLTHSEHLFDLTGSVTYIGMVGIALWLSGATDIRSIALVGVILIWALRLGPFLYLRIKQAGEDRRFRKIRQSFPLFLMTWTLQGTWVFITASCALAAISSIHHTAVGMPFWLGLALWIFGFAIEVIADRQKTAFRADPENTGKFINSGLWAWSRHPNYFGEILLWLGIAIMAYPALMGWQLATLISPLFVVFLLMFISGVPMLETRAHKLWGQDPQYIAYKRNTPLLMLWPPKQ